MFFAYYERASIAQLFMRVSIVSTSAKEGVRSLAREGGHSVFLVLC